MLRIVVPPREWISSVNLCLDPATSWMKVIPCTDSAVHGNDWVDTNDKNGRGHSVEGSFSREFSSINIVRKLWPSEVGSRSRCYRKTCFWKKRPLAGRFWKFRSETIHHLSDPHLVCDFVKFGWPEIGKVVRYLRDKKNKISAHSLASVWIVPKICQGQWQTMYSQCPKFHPNWFTSGGVIANRVNAVQSCHKVFLILCVASASSPSKVIRSLEY